MFRKLSITILISAISATAVFAQQTAPEGGRVRATVFSNMFDGSYLGVEMKEVSKENFSRYGLNEVRGVAVEKVVENSPADRAGLQNGDVIIRFDGAEVTSVRKLSRLISEVAPDHQATVTVLRNGGEREIKVTMGKREFPTFENSGNLLRVMPSVPAMPPMPPMPDMPRVPLAPTVPFSHNEKDGSFMFFGANRRVGISVTSLTEQLGEYFGATGGKGILISSVRENSPASKAGLRAGDIIVEADGKEVKNSFDLTRSINEKKEGAVNLTVIRNKSRLNISVEPEKADGNFRIVTPEGSNIRLTSPAVIIGDAPEINF